MPTFVSFRHFTKQPGPGPNPHGTSSKTGIPVAGFGFSTMTMEVALTAADPPEVGPGLEATFSVDEDSPRVRLMASISKGFLLLHFRFIVFYAKVRQISTK